VDERSTAEEGETTMTVAARLRGKIAERGVPAYKVAAEAEIHPVTLSRMLHGHLPLPAEVAARINGAIDRVERRPTRRPRP
jgi:hypothetical protein